MDEIRTNEIFKKYNPVDSVVRCPNGRAKVRKQLDVFAIAAVNMYGIIKIAEFVEIYNSLNSDKTTIDEVRIILLPNILKYTWYGFYKDYIIHYDIFLNIKYVQYLEQEQGDKPRYIPSKEKFLDFNKQYTDDNDHWYYVHKFMWETFGSAKGYFEIKNYILYNQGINELGPIMEKNGIEFDSEEQAYKFFDLLIAAKNNTPIWENKGYSPIELQEIFNTTNKNEITFKKSSKVGPNDPCPCGSGKKYKKCCSLNENSNNANLSYSERKLFYMTWLKLLKFINKKLNIIDYEFTTDYPGDYDETLIFKINEKLWEDPRLINEYIINNSDLLDREVKLLQSWKDKFINGDFLLLKYFKEYALFMEMNGIGIPKLYAVKGITDSVADTINRQLPILLKTVLLPFEDKIIYNSFLLLQSISFGSEIKKKFMEEYAKSKKTYGIITKL